MGHMSSRRSTPTMSRARPTFSTAIADLGLGLADASIVVLAGRHQTVDVLTLDERHFRAISGPHDRPFRLLPADA